MATRLIRQIRVSAEAARGHVLNAGALGRVSISDGNGRVSSMPELDEYDRHVLLRIAARLVVTETDCWEWGGHRNQQGYGEVSYKGRTSRVHRITYALMVGAIPLGMHLDHFVCDNPPCCNPHHVRPASARENVLRANTFVSANAAKTRCPRGHELTGENVRIEKSGGRRCKPCSRVAQAKSRERKKDRVGRGETLPLAKAKKSQCAQGHEYSDENSYFDSLGGRHCRPCHRHSERERRARLKAPSNQQPPVGVPAPPEASTGPREVPS